MSHPPTFLDLPDRTVKPRSSGLTHVLDKGMPVAHLEAWLTQAGQFVDILKVGWGVGYVDATLKDRVALCHSAGVIVCLGGTLVEIASVHRKVSEFHDWALELEIDAVEVSNGLMAMTRADKTALVRRLSASFSVLAETGAKGAAVPVVGEEWSSEMLADLDAGARWVIAEGRESGTVGLYDAGGRVRSELVDTLVDRVPQEHLIFEAPVKAQQTWFVRRLGANVNLGNIALDEAIALETLRVGLRADTALGGLA